ncbi:hypothetical protein JR316_0004259, partial [Psilocybe cubensis]
GAYSTIFNDYTLILSSAMISRLILELRSATKDSNRSRVSVIQFAPPRPHVVSIVNEEHVASNPSRWASLVRDFEDGHYESHPIENPETEEAK